MIYNKKISEIAKDIALNCNQKGCIVILTDDENVVSLGSHGLNSAEVLEGGNVLIYSTLRKEFEQTNYFEKPND